MLSIIDTYKNAIFVEQLVTPTVTFYEGYDKTTKQKFFQEKKYADAINKWTQLIQDFS